MRVSAFKKNLLYVIGMTLLTKVFGFLKQVVTASTFGANQETDLISLSQGFIGNIQYVLVQVLITSFVSTYIYLKAEDEDEVSGFAIAVGKVFTLIAGGIILLIFLAAPLVAKLIAPSYEAYLTTKLATYLRLFSPTLLLFVWIAVFHALLNANRRFVTGELIGINQSIILMILVTLLAPTLGVDTLSVSFFVYSIWNVLFLCIASWKFWSWHRGNPFTNRWVKKLLSMTVPLFWGYAMVYINQQVDKILASGLEVGTVTALSYGAVLSNLVEALIVTLCSVLFSYFTTHLSRGEEATVAELAQRGISIFTVGLLPITLITIFCAEDIVTLAFGRGAFDSQSVSQAALALSGYGVAFIPLAFREIFSRVLYGYQDTKSPMVNSSIAIVCNIMLSIALCPNFGILGVTFASSVSTAICGVLNAISAKKKNPNISFLPFFKTLPILLIGGVACTLVLLWGQQSFQGYSPFLRLCLITICSGTAYLLCVSPILWRELKKIKEVTDTD